MPSRPTCQIANPELAAQIAAQKARIADLEQRLWDDGLRLDLLAPYQAAFRQLEELVAASGSDTRHRFVIVIPVADRPQQLRDCLDSLLELCACFGYGGHRDGRYAKLAVVIADDSADPAQMAGNRAIADEFSRRGIATAYFGQDEQFAAVAALGATERAQFARIVGSAARTGFSHKGQAVTRNIAYLWLAQTESLADDRLLIYTIDSDQEFKVKVATPQGDRDVYAVNFFHYLDQIFATTDAQVLTGKVVGDPPVSPAVMSGNFIADVISLLQELAAVAPTAPCCHHGDCAHSGSDAAYHDMADLFGFKHAADAFRYRCPLPGAHSNADCLHEFAARVNSFFFGEHPTRVTYYEPGNVMESVQPARTVYAGNYLFRPAGLGDFIPFAPLRLRMSGPTLGRIVKARLQARFVSANLPMLHKRTVRATGQSEFRPGIHAGGRDIDLCDEFERQFHGDVMLFSVERLTALGFPQHDVGAEVIAATLKAVHAEMLDKYNAKHRAIVGNIHVLHAFVHAPEHWWNSAPAHAAAVAHLAAFVANMNRNFGAGASCYDAINAPANGQAWQARQLDALLRYPDDSRAWRAALFRAPA